MDNGELFSDSQKSLYQSCFFHYWALEFIVLESSENQSVLRQFRYLQYDVCVGISLF